MHLHKHLQRIAALAIILILTISASAFAESAGFVRAVNARVYENSDLSGRSVSINRYMPVDVVAVNNGIATIRANGYTVYIAADLLTVFDEADRREMEFTRAALVYEYPTTSSASMYVRKGARADVLYTANGCAVVEIDGEIGYTYLSALATPQTDAATTFPDGTAGYVKARGARVYANSNLTGRSVSINRYMLVDVLEVRNGAAKIVANGYTVYIDADSLFIFDADDITRKVFVKDTRAYEYPSTSSAFATVKEGTEVNVLYTVNGCAVIESNGAMAYTFENALTDPIEITYGEFEAVVTSGANVYESLYRSDSVLGNVSEGEHVTVTAYTSARALIETDCFTGWCPVSALKKYVEPKYTAEEIFAGDFTNEKTIYLYLVHVMELSPAAACGILANINAESGFRPEAYNSSGGSYGICQWTGGRYTNLQNWCAENGYDYATMEGQLRFLEYELKNRYTSVYRFMQGVANTADGAYDAGYHWCYYYEIPANRAARSVQRGNTAKDTYWAIYMN